jgi:hypothetical protein
MIIYMDEVYENILIKMNYKRNSHPNMIKLWESYLKYKKQDFLDNLKHCENMIKKIETVNDLSTINILSLYILLNNRYT